MTVRERIIASRLIQKIDNQASYANQIGLSYSLLATNESKEKPKTQATTIEKND